MVSENDYSDLSSRCELVADADLDLGRFPVRLMVLLSVIGVWPVDKFFYVLE